MEAQHVRPVDWIAQDIPRTVFGPDLLNSLGGLATVFRIRAPDAESRIQNIADQHSAGITAGDTETTATTSDDGEFKVDLEEQITDRIIERIRQRFSGTRLEHLVAEILKASGYHATETRQGPDGGIDVVAGQGDMGFGHPRLCVQVKSGRSAVDLADYNRLQGNIGSYGADHGLLVSLGDFTRTVRNENERSFFQIRLWGPSDLVDKLVETYDSLPEYIQSEIPLRNRRILIETED
jgi:restriction system protein